MIPKRLFTRMKANSAVRNGTYLRYSGPIMSRAIVLRTMPWNDSPRNCALARHELRAAATASRNSA